MNRKDLRLYEMKADILKALAHPLRLALIDRLRDGEQCVCDLARAVGAERSNVSRHLGLMVAAEVLSCRKEGLMVFYSLQSPCVLNFFTCIEKVLRRRFEEGKSLLGSL